jgi:hypothetical protein
VLLWLFTFPLNVNHASSKEMQVSDQETHWQPILCTTCNISVLFLVYRKELLYGPNLSPVLKVLLTCELRILTPHSEQPTSTTIFCVFFFICVSILSFFSYNKTFSCFNFFQHSLLSSKDFPLFSLLFFHMPLLQWNIIFKTSGKILSLTHILQK